MNHTCLNCKHYRGKPLAYSDVHHNYNGGYPHTTFSGFAGVCLADINYNVVREWDDSGHPVPGKYGIYLCDVDKDDGCDLWEDKLTQEERGNMGKIVRLYEAAGRNVVLGKPAGRAGDAFQDAMDVIESGKIVEHTNFGDTQ